MDALLVIDVQRDFCPGGSLAVPGGDEIVPLINRLMDRFECVAATKDWHPPGHVSFAGTHGRRPGETIMIGGLEQILWPEHCVQGGPGAEFESRLNTSRITRVILKGEDPSIDSYSGFYDNARKKETGLLTFLHAGGVDHVWVCGLALDFCVLYTAQDAVRLGFRTTLIRDACRGIDIDGSAEKALRVMREAGVEIAESTQVLEGRQAAS